MSWTQSTGRHRPGFRGTRGGRGSQGGVINERREWRERGTFQEPPPPPYGELLFVIERDGIEESPYDPKITSCSYVASYTWLHRSAPSIMIPGSPPMWNPPSHSRRLDSDKGEYFRDPNAARYPSHPLEPAVLATLEQRPELATDEIDIFTCSSTLGNLSRFVRGVDKSFRFVIEKAGSTIFFIRRENSPTQLIPDVRGYGHTFPEEYTSWGKGLAGAESHQRIIRYTFGGLRFLLRFEADGYIRKDEDEADSISEQPVEVNDLIDMLQVQQPVADSKRLNIERGGRPVPQEDIIDIKTRSAFDFKTRTIKKEIDMTDLTPRLWLSQIPTLVVGYHERGLFDDIRVRSMREEIVQCGNAITKGSCVNWYLYFMSSLTVPGHPRRVSRSAGPKADLWRLDGWREMEYRRFRQRPLLSGPHGMTRACKRCELPLQSSPGKHKGEWLFLGLRWRICHTGHKDPATSSH